MTPLLVALLLAGARVPPDATVAAAPDAAVHARHAPGDPLEGFNRTMFGVFQTLDKAILRPAAIGYSRAVPRPIRSGLRNVFGNLREPIVFLNDMLQLRPGRAVRTAARFVLNSTVGVGGLFDIARHGDIPHRPNGFGDTLGYYGVKPGPYIFLPIVGPSTVRDLLGDAGDGLVLPTAIGAPFDQRAYQIPKTIVTGLDQRAEADGDLQALYAGALDPYATLRSVYLQNRAAEITALKARHGEDPAALPEDPLTDPLADPAPPPECAPASPVAGPPPDRAAPEPSVCK